MQQVAVKAHIILNLDTQFYNSAKVENASN